MTTPRTGDTSTAGTPHARIGTAIIGAGAIAATLDVAGDYADAAKTALEVLPAGEWRTALEQLADFAVSRAA